MQRCMSISKCLGRYRAKRLTALGRVFCRCVPAPRRLSGLAVSFDPMSLAADPIDLSMFERWVDVPLDKSLDEWLRGVPAKWVVYLMTDEADRPVQLLCVRNLRASLKRRLTGEELVGATRRVNYRELVRHIHWRRVDSPFEADWVYYEIARAIFPDTYAGMTGLRPAWFVHVDLDANFPRYTKTTNLSIGTGLLLGPIEDKHAAARLIEEVEDAFDLCRYYSILVQSPNGSACAYKEMGKCPAPCDGSISLPQYRRLIDLSLSTLQNPGQYIGEQTARMGHAARSLAFESAAKIKVYIDQLAKLTASPFRHRDTLERFCFISIQRGPKAGTAKVFLILQGRVIELLCLRDKSFDAEEVMRAAVDRAAALPLPAAAMSTDGMERIGLVVHHLFATKTAPGAFLRVGDLDREQIRQAYNAVMKRPEPVESDGEEGVTRELQRAE